MKDEFIDYELACLWSELEREERHSLSSHPDTPSTAMEWIMERIKMATAIIGPISWMHISTEWLLNGRYEYWAKYMGIEYEPPKLEELSGFTWWN